MPGQGPWRDDEGLPEDAGELEALPPPGEVHHDWPGRADRHRRGWITPGDDADGESW